MRLRTILSSTMLAFSLLFTMASAAHAQMTSTEDVVYLKDGSVIRGTIVEQRPGESVLIRTRDGNTMRYTMDRIEKMTKETVAMSTSMGVGRKEPAVAFVLSLLVPGAGQGYNGQWGKGALMFGGAVVGLGLVLSDVGSDYCAYDYYTGNEDCGSNTKGEIGALLYVGSILWSVIDAPISASKINRQAGLAFHPSIVPLKSFASKPRFGLQVATITF